MFILKIIKNTTKLSRIIILISLFFMLLIAGGLTYLHYNIFIVSNTFEGDMVFTVNPGSSVNEVLIQLKNDGIISSNKIAKIYYKIKYNEDSIKAGEYIFSDAITIEKALKTIIAGEVVSDEVKIVIPEGYNIFDIGDRLEKAGLVSLDEFLHFSAEYTLEDFMLVSCSKAKPRPVSCSLAFPLEGYLFPDTYQFKKSATIEDIQEKLIGNFGEKIKTISVDELPEFFRQGSPGMPGGSSNKAESLVSISCSNAEASSISCSLAQTIILASLLEREVSLHSDRQVVAGIMQKRIQAGMPLQIDATVLYAHILKDYRAGREINMESSGHNPVSLDDLALDSPYNTYKYRGLPPGPICNPGVDSINAVINAVKTDYWYYLNAKDGTTIFSKTYEEHLKNKAKYLK